MTRSYDMFCYKKKNCLSVKNNTTKNNNMSKKMLQSRMISFDSKRSVVGRVFDVRCVGEQCKFVCDSSNNAQ